MFNRRKFLTGLLALPGVALAKILPEPKPTATIPGLGSWNGLIDRFMEDTSDRPLFGPWRIWWTGWKDSQCSIDLVGQWVAWPVRPDGTLDDNRLGVYVSTPGGWGSFRRGEVCNLSYRWPQQLASNYMHKWTSREAIEKSMEPERRITLESLLELCRASDWKMTAWHEENTNSERAYPKLSKRVQFYLDPQRYVKIHHGIDVIHERNRDREYEDLLSKAQKQLLG